MRWQQLFADLQAQFETAEDAEARAEWASRARAEMGAVRLADRLAGSVGSEVVLTCRGAGRVTGVLADVGVDWLLVDDGRGRDQLVSTGAVRAVSGLGRWAAPAEDDAPVRVRLDLRRALRGLARDRSAVQVVLDEGTVLTGTIDRVGADYVDLAEHAADEPRRAGAVRQVHAVVIDAVAVVRTLLPGWD
ncbi:hypothetical protein [Blastococcus saxobsidens]|uniref:Fis family transcriptional regulator n=1 Tax=Blastococcus saxobsidens TaxID=138336 RepID=A0A4Q7Y7J2_9ACTN|nr:hypothetical protein [Blastococcus saxobsidens]RZU32992.1 hypothetical protein BKA19_2707 [Blastococcus saxobsidens]